MSTTVRERHSVLRIFKGRRECTGHHATCGALPAAGPYLRLSRFQDVPPQPNSPPDNVLRPDRPAEASLGSKRRGCYPASDSRIGLESSSTGSSFPADSAKLVPLAVVSLDSRQGHRIPIVRTSSELAVRRPGKAPERAVPSPSPGRHEAVRSRHVSSSSSPPTVDGGCSPWRPDAVMSTTGHERHSVLWIFKGRRECTRHHATCGALPAAGPYLRLSRFQGGQACRSHGTFPLFGLQSSHLNICYYHQDLHRRPLRPGSCPRFCSDRRALLLIEAWLLPRRPGIGRALQRHPFSGLVDSAADFDFHDHRPEHADAEARLLFIFTSRYLFAIGLSPIFSLGQNLPPDWGCIPKQPDSELGPGPSLRTLLQTTIRTPKTSDFQAGLFPVRSPLLRESLIKFTTACQDAPGVLSSDLGQPRAVTHERSASVPYPREDGGTTICDTQADVPSARMLGVQLAFKDSMV
ncbi:unnamed protein product, partial [Brassica rapa subsp. narinosa]